MVEIWPISVVFCCMCRVAIGKYTTKVLSVCVVLWLHMLKHIGIYVIETGPTSATFCCLCRVGVGKYVTKLWPVCVVLFPAHVETEQADT